MATSSENYILDANVQQLATWTARNQRCQTEYGTSLASIRNAASMSEAESVCSGIGATACYIGLIRNRSSATENSFYWLDGSEWSYGDLQNGWNPGDYPWGANQPNDLSANEDCVALHTSYQYKWVDWVCGQSIPFLCNQPTPTPTPSPSAAPSNPTKQPSKSPSAAPSKQPSTLPSSGPSQPPTANPVRNPVLQIGVESPATPSSASGRVQEPSLSPTVLVPVSEIEPQQAQNLDDSLYLYAIIFTLVIVLGVVLTCCWRYRRKAISEDQSSPHMQSAKVEHDNVSRKPVDSMSSTAFHEVTGPGVQITADAAPGVRSDAVRRIGEEDRRESSSGSGRNDELYEEHVQTPTTLQTPTTRA